MTQKPPYPERLVKKKMKNQISFLKFDMIEELHNSYVKIHLLQAIK